MTTRKARALPQGKFIRCEGPADFGAYYDGNLIGYRATRLEAEMVLDAYVYELLKRGNAPVGVFAAAA